ncbi:CppA C-terminal domain-containing protein, partial [Shigella sonnei]|nr:CppA C-terminal domain-containing protein [Shigella sonnei]
KTFKGLSDFEIIAMDLNVADQSIIEFYESVFGLKAINNQIEFPFVTLTFSVVESEDLAAGTDEVLDLEFLVVMIDKSSLS